MLDFLENLRNKPARLKKQIAFLVALTLAGVIFVIWLSVIYPNWRADQVTTPTPTEPSPLSLFSTKFSAGLSAVSDQFSKIKDVISSFSTSPTFYVSSSTNE
jgi:hypothetical protein